MSCTDAKQEFARDFATCVQLEKVAALDSYLPDLVQPDCTVDPADFRLVPLTTTSRRFFNASSDCVTDCMLELQCKYQQFIPDDWGGRMERGWRDLGVIGFNLLADGGLEILEINETGCHAEWAEPILASLAWERILIHAVIDFGRACEAGQIRLQPAHRCYPVEMLVTSDDENAAELQKRAKQRHDGSAEVCGFVFDEATGSFVFNLD